VEEVVETDIGYLNQTA